VASLPQKPIILVVLQDFAHVLVFAGVALIMSTLIRRRVRFPGSALPYLLGFLASLAMGGVTELIQSAIGRAASWYDLGTDALGAGSAIALAAARDSRAWSRPGRSRFAVAVVGILFGLAAIYPVAHVSLAYMRRAQAFPAILEPRTALDLYFVSGTSAQTRSPLPVPWANEVDPTSLQVTFDSSRWPSFSIVETAPDWRGHESLVVDLTNPGPRALQLTLRVHDRWHNQDHYDRFNRRFTLAGHTRAVWRVPIEDIATTPRARRLDLSQVEGIVLFANGPLAAGENQLYITSLRLE
jgi:hypothetical protein